MSNSTSNASDDLSLKLEKYVSDFYDARERIKIFEKQKNNAREKIAEIMHTCHLNEIIVDTDKYGQLLCIYTRTSRKNVDYQALYEIVGPHEYNKIVQEKDSTYLSIRHPPKNKKSAAKKAPKENSTLLPPSGVLT